jgi:hypothetical protein
MLRRRLSLDTTGLSKWPVHGLQATGSSCHIAGLNQHHFLYFFASQRLTSLFDSDITSYSIFKVDQNSASNTADEY